MFACRYFKNEKLLAVCDRELVGRKLNLGEVEIEIKKSFYFEKFCSEEEIRELLKEARTINMFGEKILEIARSQKLAGDEVKIIDGVPHAQIYKI